MIFHYSIPTIPSTVIGFSNFSYPFFLYQFITIDWFYSLFGGQCNMRMIVG